MDEVLSLQTDLPRGAVLDIPYRRARLNGEAVTLSFDLYRPEDSTEPSPVLVWFHAGAFCMGSPKRQGNRMMGRHAMRHGVTLVVPEYRLATPQEDLSPSLQAHLPELLTQCPEGFRLELAGSWALAALEDSVALLQWLEAEQEALGHNGHLFVGGASAGGINALNTVHAAPALGLETPAIQGAVCYSGAFAYPDLYQPGRVPVLAAHDVADKKVSIASIRDLAARDALVELIESTVQGHGYLTLFEGERKAKSYGRIFEFVKRVTETNRLAAQ